MNFRLVKQPLKLAMSFGFLLFAQACAKPPTQEIADAENAVDVAMQAGAEEYAAEELQTAKDALADAKAKVENKGYKEARNAAQDAKAKADTAQMVIEPRKKIAKPKVEERFNSLKPDLESLQTDAAKLKGKDSEKIKSDVAFLNELWNSVQADINGEHYEKAIASMANAAAQIRDIKAEIEDLRAAKGTKKKQ